MKEQGSIMQEGASSAKVCDFGFEGSGHCALHRSHTQAFTLTWNDLKSVAI